MCFIVIEVWKGKAACLYMSKTSSLNLQHLFNYFFFHFSPFFLACTLSSCFLLFPSSIPCFLLSASGSSFHYYGCYFVFTVPSLSHYVFYFLSHFVLGVAERLQKHIFNIHALIDSDSLNVLASNILIFRTMGGGIKQKNGLILRF